MKNRKRKDFEIKFYEALLRERPDFFHALASLGDAYTRKGFYREGLAIDRKLSDLKPEDPIVRYNLACSLSLLGEIEQSLEELKLAVLLGYDDTPYILQDKDLANLRNHPRFETFYQKLARVQQHT